MNKRLISGLLFFSLPLLCFSADYAAQKQTAETLVSEASYGSALEIYQQLSLNDIPEEEKQWVAFRVLDCGWKSNPKIREENVQKLIKSVSELIRENQKDILFAEMNESIADSYFHLAEHVNFYAANIYYEAALNWWAAHEDIDYARERYLNIIFKMSKSKKWPRHYTYGSYGQIAQQYIIKALRIAQDDLTKAKLSYFLTTAMRYQSARHLQSKLLQRFEDSISIGKENEYHDDALRLYADYLNQTGLWMSDGKGNWSRKPDYKKALALFKRISTEYVKGDSKHWDYAVNQIKQITDPQLHVNVYQTFRPVHEIPFNIQTRNTDSVRFSLYPISLKKDVKFKEDDHNWINSLKFNTAPVAQWGEETKADAKYAPFNKQFTLPEKLSMGAYVLEARSGELSARELILVSEQILTAKVYGKELTLFLCDASTGAPIAEAEAVCHVQRQIRGNNRTIYKWERLTSVTDKNGRAHFKATQPSYNHRYNFFLTSSSGTQEAFMQFNHYHHDQPSDSWKIMAETDRPAYRPGETVKWKINARQKNSDGLSIPSDQSLHIKIKDPKGTDITKSTQVLNQFGSAWGEFTVPENAGLGAYRIEFRNKDNNYLGTAELFRLEEYKTPEFVVTVVPDKAKNEAGSYRMGDRITAKVKVDYYFGGGVPNAEVSAVINYSSVQVHSPFPHEYDWFYKASNDQRRHHGRYGGYQQPQQLITINTRTDENGEATLEFDTANLPLQNTAFSIDVKATDSSRRQVNGSGKINVSWLQYRAALKTSHKIYQPDSKAGLTIKTLDINNEPVSTSGRVTVIKRVWVEEWLSPDGQTLKGEELLLRKIEYPSFPPPGVSGWSLIKQAYEDLEIISEEITTDKSGEALFNFEVADIGYYRIVYSGLDIFEERIESDTYVWVSDQKNNVLGYQSGMLGVIIDKTTLTPGHSLPVLITSVLPGRYALITVEGSELYSQQLIHMTKTSKLINLPINKNNIPDVNIHVQLVSHFLLHQQMLNVKVPPAEQFLDVEVAYSAKKFKPSEKGFISISVKDYLGEPVSTEISLAGYDESLSYIQQDGTKDPRTFFFDNFRRGNVTNRSSLQNRSFYVPPVQAQIKQDRSGIKGGFADKISHENDFSGSGSRSKGRAVGTLAEGRLDDFEADLDLLKASSSGLRSQLSKAKRSKKENRQNRREEPVAEIIVRKNFSKSLIWEPALMSGKDGKAEVEVSFPDSLSKWTARVSAASLENEFGRSTASAKTQLPLMARLQTPRFLTVGDQSTISMILNNNTDQPLTITPELELTGLELIKKPTSITVPANSEKRADWSVSARSPGNAVLKGIAQAGTVADAMEISLPVIEHGIDRLLAHSGKSDEDSFSYALEIPSARKKGSTEFSIQVTPSLALTMLDALPYLLHYPYGCTEQTMSRFLPAVSVANTLEKQGIDPAQIEGKIFGGIEQEHVGKTHKKGKHELSHLDAILKDGIKRLKSLQHADGGFGWWKDDDSDYYMTAYVIWGLHELKAADKEIPEDMLQKASNYLSKELVQAEDDIHLQAWMLHALAYNQSSSAPVNAAKENLWKNRDRLNSYSRALFALACHQLKDTDKTAVLARNILNGINKDLDAGNSILGGKGSGANQETASWGKSKNYWRWSDGAVESTAFCLRALLAINPENENIDRAMNWLIKNRRGAQWSNTKDTAITLLALNAYLVKTDELGKTFSYEIIFNGEKLSEQTVSPETVFNLPTTIMVNPDKVVDGINTVKIIRKGDSGRLYYGAFARFFSLEEPIPAAGNELFVKRQYYRVHKVPTLLHGEKSIKVLLNEGDPIVSGDNIEVVLTVETKNDYEYLLFEDLKPAGFEATQVKSGQTMHTKQLSETAAQHRFNEGEESVLSSDYAGASRYVYQELRDQKVAMFVSDMPQGYWELRYELRAETPGNFHALPLLAQAMYVPEIKANSKEFRVEISDKN